MGRVIQMDSVYELASLLPFRTGLANVDEYLAHHYQCMTSCVEQELYSSAFSHLHLLYMTYVYIQLLRIAQDKEYKKAFEYCWIGFPTQEKSFLKDPDSPFSFSPLNEKSVFRFFRLLGFDDATVGDIAKPVDDRNDKLHAAGAIFCSAEDEFEIEIQKYINRIKRIDVSQQKFLRNIYKSLIKTYDEDYEIAQDDINTNFIEQYSLSESQLIGLAHNRTDKISIFISAQ